MVFLILHCEVFLERSFFFDMAKGWACMYTIEYTDGVCCLDMEAGDFYVC